MGALDREQLDQLLAIQRGDGRRFGEIVVSRGLVSKFMLLTALKRQKELAARQRRRGKGRRPAPWKPLGEILVERGHVTPVQVKQALADQTEDGGFIGESLLERGWITAVALVDALAQQLESASATEREFVVRELENNEWKLLHRASSFEDATDYVFDEVLLRREPQQLAIISRQGSCEELVWSYGPEPTGSETEASYLVAAFRRTPVETALAS